MFTTENTEPTEFLNKDDYADNHNVSQAVDRLLPVHHAEVITYLKLAGMKTALSNFNVPLLRDGLKRISV